MEMEHKIQRSAFKQCGYIVWYIIPTVFENQVCRQCSTLFRQNNWPSYRSYLHSLALSIESPAAHGFPRIIMNDTSSSQKYCILDKSQFIQSWTATKRGLKKWFQQPPFTLACIGKSRHDPQGIYGGLNAGVAGWGTFSGICGISWLW